MLRRLVAPKLTFFFFFFYRGDNGKQQIYETVWRAE